MSATNYNSGEKLVGLRQQATELILHNVGLKPYQLDCIHAMLDYKAPLNTRPMGIGKLTATRAIALWKQQFGPLPTHDGTKLRPDVVDAMLDTRLMQRYGDAWAHYAPDSFGSECEEMGVASARPVMTTSTAWGLL